MTPKITEQNTRFEQAVGQTARVLVMPAAADWDIPSPSLEIDQKEREPTSSAKLFGSAVAAAFLFQALQSITHSPTLQDFFAHCGTIMATIDNGLYGNGMLFCSNSEMVRNSG